MFRGQNIDVLGLWEPLAELQACQRNVLVPNHTMGYRRSLSTGGSSWLCQCFLQENEVEIFSACWLFNLVLRAEAA